MFVGRAGSDPGPGQALAVNRECSGITGTCMALTRSTYLALGGLNEVLDWGSDIDLSFKADRAGLRRVWLAHTVLSHFPPDVDPRVSKADRILLSSRWAAPHVDQYMPSYGQWRLQRARREEAVLHD